MPRMKERPHPATSTSSAHLGGQGVLQRLPRDAGVRLRGHWVLITEWDVLPHCCGREECEQGQACGS